MQNFIKHLTQQIDLTEDQIQLLSKNITIKDYKRGEMIQNAGEFTDHYYFIEKGVIRSYTIDENGKEHIIQFGPENWIVSDRNISSADREVETIYYIQAIEDTKAIIINEELNQFIQSLNNYYMESQFKLVQKNVQHLHDRIRFLLSATAKMRYQNFIKLYPTITARVPQWMIASYLGITPESLSRVRKDIASNG